jgi:hypothetical protein
VKSEVLPEKTKALFEKFEGGDHIGHRQSVDLDWFTPSEFDEKVWQMKWETKWKFNMQSRDWQTLVGEIAGVKTSLYYYEYPLIGDVATYRGFK